MKNIKKAGDNRVSPIKVNENGDNSAMQKVTFREGHNEGGQSGELCASAFAFDFTVGVLHFHNRTYKELATVG